MSKSRYTYILSWILLPIILFLLFIYLIYIRTINIKQIALLIFPAFILAIPLFILLFINFFDIDTVQIGCFSIPHLFIWREGEFSFSNVISNIGFIWKAITYDGVDFNSSQQFGTIYYIMIPVFIFGVFKNITYSLSSVKKCKYDISVIILVVFIANYLLSLFISVPVIYKVNSWYFSIGLMTILGVYELNKKYKVLFYITIIGFLCSSSIYVFDFYNFSNAKTEKFLFKEGIGELIINYQELYPNMDIYVESYDEKPYAWYLPVALPDPYSIDAKNYEANNVHFYLPDKNVDNAIYILYEDYERISELYQEYEEDPDSLALEGYNQYQIYIKW